MINLQMQLRNGQIVPVTQYDAQRLEDYKDGSLFNMKPTKQRSNPHHNLYWATLRNVCDATGKWPTDQHLHHELKIVCGFYKTHFSPLTGSIVRIVDSISFDKMTQQEFNTYFELAMQKLADAIGCDPLELGK